MFLQEVVTFRRADKSRKAVSHAMKHFQSPRSVKPEVVTRNDKPQPEPESKPSQKGSDSNGLQEDADVPGENNNQEEQENNESPSTNID